MAFDEHPFWDFSLAVYRAAGVAPACIALQDRHGIDVNALLFCIWLGANGRGAVAADELGRALDGVAAWNRNVVCGLRAVRRWMKDGTSAVEAEQADAQRRRILAVEVDCEHAEQLALAGAVARPADDGLAPERRLDDAIANIALYLHRLGVAPDAADRSALATLLAAAFADTARERIEARLARI